MKAVPFDVPAKEQTRSQLEPKAIEMLNAACARLAAALSIEFTAVEIFESPSRLGLPLVYGTKSDVLLQRPDKLSGGSRRSDCPFSLIGFSAALHRDHSPFDTHYQKPLSDN